MSRADRTSVCTSKTLVALRNGYPGDPFHFSEKKMLGHEISILKFYQDDVNLFS